MKSKLNRPLSADGVEDARRRLGELLAARGAWFLREGRDAFSTVELRRGEWELSAARGSLLLSFWGEAGARTWRVAAWAREGEKVLLEATRRAGAERARLELVPRASLAESKQSVAEARRAACARLSALVCAARAGSKVERAALSAGARRGEPGRYARILLKDGRTLFAATGPVVELGAEETDAFLASALLWFMRLRESASARSPRELWLVIPPKLRAPVSERISLLREDLRAAIRLSEVDEGQRHLTHVEACESGEPSLSQTPRLSRPPKAEEWSELARRVVALAPEALDVVRSRRGETLRYHGLAFARVRRLLGTERLWFGVGRGKSRRLLDESNWPELLKLLEELHEHRRAEAHDRRHALYAAAPEAWLESLLRRDITRLDPGLRLAPLHAQFRAARDTTGASRPVDLLALRRDGRLVVIELKVSEDAALPLQGADYWRRVSAHQRAGHLTSARLFGDAELSPDPPLVYLVAPLLRFHRSFQILARCLSPDIQTYRFDLNEDWRTAVRVARRCALT
ncbi:MAG TPA: hypothetical protein VFS10_17585 [Pyrinomonadaceae bacterium]|nr:hypothetical protein [Pyrinomonadaceae bacterium]